VPNDNGLWPMSLGLCLPRRTASRTKSRDQYGTLPCGVPRQWHNPLGAATYRQLRAKVSLPELAYEFAILASVSGSTGEGAGVWVVAGTICGVKVGTVRPNATCCKRPCSASTLAT
jgi:hypothetical protein